MSLFLPPVGIEGSNVAISSSTFFFNTPIFLTHSFYKMQIDGVSATWGHDASIFPSPVVRRRTKISEFRNWSGVVRPQAKDFSVTVFVTVVNLILFLTISRGKCWGSALVSFAWFLGHPWWIPVHQAIQQQIFLGKFPFCLKLLILTGIFSVDCEIPMIAVWDLQESAGGWFTKSTAFWKRSFSVYNYRNQYCCTNPNLQADSSCSLSCW